MTLIEQQGGLGWQQGGLGWQQGGLGSQQGGLGWQQGGLGWQQGGLGWQQGGLGGQQGGLGGQHFFGGFEQQLHPSTGGQHAHSSIFLHWHSTLDGVSQISSCHPQGV